MSKTHSATGDTIQDPVTVDDDTQSSPLLLHEASDEIELDFVPPVDTISEVDLRGASLQDSGRRRGRAPSGSGPSPRATNPESDSLHQQGSAQPERLMNSSHLASTGTEDEKKKMGMMTLYDGFSIYGFTLYLVVTRTFGPTGTTDTSSGSAGGQAMIKDWIASTQQAVQDV